MKVALYLILALAVNSGYSQRVESDINIDSLLKLLKSNSKNSESDFLKLMSKSYAVSRIQICDSVEAFISQNTTSSIEKNDLNKYDSFDGIIFKCNGTFVLLPDLALDHLVAPSRLFLFNSKLELAHCLFFNNNDLFAISNFEYLEQEVVETLFILPFSTDEFSFYNLTLKQIFDTGLMKTMIKKFQGLDFSGTYLKTYKKSDLTDTWLI